VSDCCRRLLLSSFVGKLYLHYYVPFSSANGKGTHRSGFLSNKLHLCPCLSSCCFRNFWLSFPNEESHEIISLRSWKRRQQVRPKRQYTTTVRCHTPARRLVTQLATLVIIAPSSAEAVFGLLKRWFAVSKSANSVIAMFLLLVSVRTNKHGV